MASKTSMQNAQIPLGCQLCENGTKIQWKCINCSLFLCSKCKENHLKIKDAKNHTIVDFKEVRPEKQSKENLDFSEINCQEHHDHTCIFYCKTCAKFICVKCITKVHKGHDASDQEEYNAEINKLLEIQRETENKLKKLALSKTIPSTTNVPQFESENREVSKQKTEPNIEITRHFTVDLRNIHTVISYSEGLLWISDASNKVIQNVKLTNENTQVLSEFNINVYDIAINSTNNLLLSVVGETRLQLRNDENEEISYSEYNVAPLLTCSIHVTRDNKVIIGAKTQPNEQSAKRKVVIVMDEKGNNIKQYEHDDNNQPLFTFPDRLTSTNNGNICVVDELDASGRGRVIVLGQTGNIVQIYTGHPNVNSKDRPFTPIDILTTPADNLIVTDCNNSSLHILNSNGTIITTISTADVGISLPYSLALSVPGFFYIGCATLDSSPHFERAKLFEVQYSGF
ncbi:uncharacterized protein LOC134726090 [Mytilus trossulus]|uniref:uncharacterized protein LOC134726090 n=1 Tax=Mytilus trossulus TaxID=6551 RepID=UPI003004622B